MLAHVAAHKLSHVFYLIVASRDGHAEESRVRICSHSCSLTALLGLAWSYQTNRA